jgi:nitrite reductase/ring-hydroxylating ferredoxin subunit
MHERLLELADYCGRLGAEPSAPVELMMIEETFRKLAGMLGGHIDLEDSDVDGDGDAAVNAYTAVLQESELRDGAMRAVEVGGASVVLSRSESGKVCAIDNVCTHASGPLAEGEREGNVVTCPWHDSQFDLCSGEVLRGPARTPERRFEARLRDGWVEVRPA